jgi:hypothetical protein
VAIITLYWYIKIIKINSFGTITVEENFYKEVKRILSIAYIIFVVSILSITSILNDSSKNISSECGPGDASCESNVRNHINGISGVELNSISYIQNNNGSPSGKFRVGVLKQDERGINQFSATITVDCNCKVIDAGGIVSH